MKIYNIIIGGALLLGASACTSSFEDLNTNHFEATEEMMETDNLKVGAFYNQMQLRVVLFDDGTGSCLSSDYQVAQGLTHDLYSGYIGPTGTWYASSGHNGMYNIIRGWNQQMFSRAFSELMPAWEKVAKQALESNMPQIKAMADIVKVEGLHRVADTYGPIPYCSFGSGNTSASYDKLEDVYARFFQELDEAIDVLTPYAQTGQSLLSDYDFIYAGDVTSWVKFANTLRLRLAIRCAYADPALAKAEAEKSIANPIGVIEAAGERAELQHGALSYFHPNYDIAYNFNAGEIRMSASMDSYMNGYKDPRRSQYFKAAADGNFHGVRLGVLNVNADKYAGTKVSNLNVDNSTTPIVWMTAAESYFLRAEGALRGWNMGGTAESFYKAGIAMSFEENNCGKADSYIADRTSKPVDYVDPTGDNNGLAATSQVTIAWDESASDETKLEKIITQKWIAMYPDGPEGWSEFRRTGYPKLLPVVRNLSNGQIDTKLQIRRMPFPGSEYDTNPDGVATGVANLGGPDTGGTKLWWDKKER